MKLLPSQKDEIYELITLAELSPSQFEWKEIPCQLFNQNVDKATELRYKNTDYHFTFETNAKKMHMAIYCPGKNFYTDQEDTVIWQAQINRVQEWLKSLVREITTPNKWSRLERELQGIHINYENGEDKFSVQEYEELKANIKLLQRKILSIGLIEEEVRIINAKLDHLIPLAENMNKFDWKSFFIGTIMNITIQLGVNKENASALFDVIKQIFNNYLLP